MKNLDKIIENLKEQERNLTILIDTLGSNKCFHDNEHIYYIVDIKALDEMEMIRKEIRKIIKQLEVK